MLDIASISALVAGAGVIIGVVLTYQELRSLVRTRQTDLLHGLYSILSSKEFLEAYEKFKVRDTKDLAEYKKKYGMVEFNQMTQFLEELSVLAYVKLIDIDLACKLFHPHFKLIWEKIKPITEELRAANPTWMWQIDYLYNEMQRREQNLQTQQ